MKTLSLKLDDRVFEDTEEVTGYLKKSRNRYINEALEFYNKVKKRDILAEQLAKESSLVAGDSMEVLNEFEGIEDEHQAV
jgi:predicted transcriptional regulator